MKCEIAGELTIGGITLTTRRDWTSAHAPRRTGHREYHWLEHSIIFSDLATPASS